jgi:hypothetical protein
MTLTNETLRLLFIRALSSPLGLKINGLNFRANFIFKNSQFSLYIYKKIDKEMLKHFLKHSSSAVDIFCALKGTVSRDGFGFR